MKRVFRKNQIVITALALLIAVAGYISYTQTGPKEPVPDLDMAALAEEEAAGEMLTDLSEEDIEDAGTTVLAASDANDVASQMKLNREQSRSKNRETLLEIIENDSLSQEQKNDAVDQLEAMTQVAERESAAENLLLAKGFTDVVVSITEDGADIVLNMGDVTEAKRAQVEDIVKRKTGIPAENIVITPINLK